MSAGLLTINTGSSSIKFRLFALTPELDLIAGGKIADIGGDPAFMVQNGNTNALPPDTTHETALDVILDWLETRHPDAVRAAAHRIVHGGERFAAPALLTAEALAYLETLNPLAPLHQPHNLAGVSMLGRRMPGLAQYGCFDTAFHARHEPLFYSYALPRALRDKGIRRYGFHGLSYDWVSHCLRADFPHLAAGRVVVAHLGNGASLCAMKGGESIDTTMGMTALDGLPMGTRCGGIDPGAVFYMLRDLNMPFAETERILYEESGLQGLSGMTNDVKTLSESAAPEARFALEYFILKTAQHIAAMAVSIGGIDALIFTGGIGENADNIRRDILARLSFLPPFETHIVAANEERCMALEIRENFAGELT